MKGVKTQKDKKLTQNLTQIIEQLQLQPPAGIPQNIPRSGAVKFVSRDEVLEELHQKLQQNQRIAITAIAGMGGLGKTDLALQYAQIHWQRETYPGGVCWLQARQSDLGIQIVSFARTLLRVNPSDDLDLLSQVQYCWHHWREGNVLIVLDDVVDYEEIQAYLPPTDPRFKILITTRQQRLGESFQQLNLEVLAEVEALDLLISFVGEARIESELEKAKVICDRLGYLPLGLELVGRYLQRKQDLSLEEIGERLGLDHSSLEDYYPDMTAPRGVVNAFDLSWQELNDRQRKLCFLLSLFALAPIPWSSVEECLAILESNELGSLKKMFPIFYKLLEPITSNKLSPNSWEDIRDELINFSLLKRTGKNLYQLDPLIREFFQSKLETLDIADKYKQSICQVMVAVAKAISSTPTRKEIEAVSSTIPHVAEVATTLTDWIRDEDISWPFIGLGKFYQGQGAYEEAIPWFSRCVSVSRNRLGKEHPDVANNLKNLAVLYESQGKYQEAEPLYLEALEMRKRLLGKEHPDAATNLNNLAALYKSQGRYLEAEPLYLEALEMRKRLLGKEHPDVATNLNNLAALYQSQGRYLEAEPLYLEALEMRKRLLGKEHPDVATSLNNLAALYQSQGRYSEAEPFYLEALEMTKRLLGEEHPNVAASLNNLALLYQSQGRYKEAEPLLLEALEMSKRLLGQQHPDVVISLNSLAALYFSQGRYSEAEPFYLEALKMSKRLLGQQHPGVANSLNGLALLYSSQGRYSEAEPFYLEALEMRKHLLGKEHPDVANSLNNLAALYQSQGRYSEAEPFYLEALEIVEQKLGINHPNTLLVRKNLDNLDKQKSVGEHGSEKVFTEI